jgi:branched-chain amino acid transport system permease protein
MSFRRFWLVSSARTAVPLALLLLLATLVFAGASASSERVYANFLIVLVPVLALQVFSGNSGIVSFGHVAFMAIGAYTAALVTIPPSMKAMQLPGLPAGIADLDGGPLLAIVLAVLVVAVVAAVVGFVLTRMEEGAMAMATIALLVIALVALENWDGLTRGSVGIYGVPPRTTMWSAFCVAVVAILVAAVFRESRTGWLLRATREDGVAAASLGVHVRLVRFRAWMLSAGVMAAGGAVWAQYNLAFGPKDFYFELTFQLLAMLVIGGMTTVSGAVAGAAVVTAVTQLGRELGGGFSVGPVQLGDIAGLTPMLVALLILAVLRFRPQGLLGLNELADAVAPRSRRRSPPPTPATASPPTVPSDPGAHP